MRDVVDLDSRSSLNSPFTPTEFYRWLGLPESTARRRLIALVASGDVVKLRKGTYVYTETVSSPSPAAVEPAHVSTTLTVRGFICQQQLGWAEGCAVQRICEHRSAADIHAAIADLRSVLDHAYGERA